MLLLVAAPLTLQSATITLDTATAAWTVSGGGAVHATPFRLDCIGSQDCLSVTSDSFATGTFVPGGSLGNFDGFWTASLNFSLPTDASGITLSYSGLFADDRTVLELNGTVIGSGGLLGPGVGQMVVTDGGPNNNFTFAPSRSSGTVTSGFILGGNNTLLAIVNNTHTGISGTLRPLTGGDGTYFGVSGTVIYATAVPEPASVALILLGAAVLAVRGGRRRARLGS